MHVIPEFGKQVGLPCIQDQPALSENVSLKKKINNFSKQSKYNYIHTHTHIYMYEVTQFSQHYLSILLQQMKLKKVCGKHHYC